MAVRKKYADWNAALNIFADYAVANGLDYQFSQAQIDEVNAERVNWNTAWANAQDAANRTPVIIEILDRRYEETDGIVRFHRMRLKFSGLNLPAEAIAAFGVHVDAERRTKLPTIDFAGVNDVESIMHLHTRIYTHDPRQGSERHYRKPDDVASIIHYTAYTAPGGPQPERAAYGAGVTITGRTIFTINHAPDTVGQVCWLITAYHNSSGNGPESEPISFPVY